MRSMQQKKQITITTTIILITIMKGHKVSTHQAAVQQHNAALKLIPVLLRVEGEVAHHLHHRRNKVQT